MEVIRMELGYCQCGHNKEDHTPDCKICASSATLSCKCDSFDEVIGWAFIDDLAILKVDFE